MLEVGLIDTMVNVLHRLCHFSDLKDEDNTSYSLLECWISFAQSIIIYLVPYRCTAGLSLRGAKIVLRLHSGTDSTTPFARTSYGCA